MRKYLTILAMIVVTFLLQSTLRVVIPSQYMLPNLLVILTCSMGLMRGKKSGMWVGFIVGMLYDLFFGNVFGLTALILMYIGYVSGFLFKIFFDADIRIPMAAVGLSDLAYNLLLYAARFLLGERVRFSSYLTGIVIPEVIASILCTILLYYVYRLVNRTIVAYEVEAQQSPWLRR